MERRPLTPEETALLRSNRNCSPMSNAEKLGIPLDHAMIALRALWEMGILPEQFKEYVCGLPPS
jgi:hypothetical protein